MSSIFVHFNEFNEFEILVLSCSFWPSDKLIGVLTLAGVCLSDPCLNGGTCSVDGDDYECSCVNGFSGGRCQIFTDAGTINLLR